MHWHHSLTYKNAKILPAICKLILLIFNNLLISELVLYHICGPIECCLICVAIHLKRVPINSTFD